MASCYANPALAERELGWKAAFGLDKMCKSIPLPSTPCVASCPSPGPPLTPTLSCCRRGPVAVAAAESHRLQQELSCGPRARLAAMGGLGPAPPASQRGCHHPGCNSSSPSCFSHGAGRQEHPQPLHSSSSTPPRFFASHRAETQGRTEPGPGFGTQGMKSRQGTVQGLVTAPAGRRCLAGPCGYCRSCSWALPGPWEVAASSA